MRQFKKDVLHWKDYDFTAINDNLEECYKQIINYINKKKNNSKNLNYNKNIIKKHIIKLVR